jgi:hypothetical protein
MHLLKADRFVGAASWDAIEIGFDERTFGPMLFKTAEHLQQKDAPKAELMETWMNTKRLNLSDIARRLEPTNTETSQRAIGCANHQIKLRSILRHAYCSRTPLRSHRGALEGRAMQLSVRCGLLLARQGTKREAVWQRWNRREIGKRVLEKDVAIVLVEQKAVSFGYVPPHLIIITELHPVGKWLPAFLIEFPEAPVCPGEDLHFDRLLLRARQDEEVERCPVVLPGREADNLPICVLPKRCIAPLIDLRRTEPPGEINNVTAGEGYPTNKVKNARHIGLATKSMAGNGHDGILPFEKTEQTVKHAKKP